MINEPVRDKFTQNVVLVVLRHFCDREEFERLQVTLLGKGYVGQVPSVLLVPGGLKFRLGLFPGDGKSTFPNFLCGLGITAVFTLSLFQTWTVELCCSVTLFHVLSAQTQFLSILAIFLGLKQQTLADSQIWKERLAKEL